MLRSALFRLACPAALLLAFGLLFVSSLRADTLWLTDYKAALAAAKESGHPMLVAFTGSWNGCARVDQEVFDTAEFKDYAAKHYVLLRLDYSVDPAKLPAAIAAQNDALKAKYNVLDFPTFLVLDPEEHLSKTMVGAAPGGPKPFIDELRKVESN